MLSCILLKNHAGILLVGNYSDLATPDHPLREWLPFVIDKRALFLGKHSPRTAVSGFFARSALPLCG